MHNRQEPAKAAQQPVVSVDQERLGSNLLTHGMICQKGEYTGQYRPEYSDGSLAVTNIS